MLYIHKEHDTYDIIREFRQYYDEKIVDNIINNYSKDKKSLKLDNISNLLVDFNRYFNEQNKKIKLSKFKDYYNNKKLQKFINENDYDELLIQFDKLDYKVKDELSKKINFDEKYNREIYLELCQLIGYQVDKVTKSFEILTENDIESALTNIKKYRCKF